MSYKIIVDSCGELTKEMKESGIFESVALGIEVGGHHIVDDETFDQDRKSTRLNSSHRSSSRMPSSA